ncbi:MAG: hypothetical protein D6826_01780 [Alphaproteobacteria bacterium]|nr:MAG: hypothetical protein D6826_01780 [Alphaproteobacteria bacterium]
MTTMHAPIRARRLCPRLAAAGMRAGLLAGLVIAMPAWIATAGAQTQTQTQTRSGTQATAYVADIDDLPLMPGLAEVAGAGIVFDKPSGRIVETYAQGALARAEVAAFYAATLPQLGWRPRGGDVYTREGERLSLVFLGVDGDLVVRFTLEPE